MGRPCPCSSHPEVNLDGLAPAREGYREVEPAAPGGVAVDGGHSPLADLFRGDLNGPIGRGHYRGSQLQPAQVVVLFFGGGLGGGGGFRFWSCTEGGEVNT